MTNERIKKLCEYIDKNKAENYPIGNEALDNETDYIKNAYFKMLAVILQQGEDIYAGQRNLFSRLIAGAACDDTMEDYLRQALEIEIDEYINFTEQCRDMDLKYRFVLDAILLTAIEQRNEDQLLLAANFIEALKVNRKETQYLALLAKSILEQDSAIYVQAEEIRPAHIPYSDFLEYTTLFVSGILCKTDDEIRIQSVEKVVLDLEILPKTDFRQRKVILRNLVINMQETPFTFTGNELVLLENCDFRGEAESILFESCKQVEINGCTFSGFKVKTILERQVSSVTIDRCRFNSCYEYYDGSGMAEWFDLGCVIDTPDWKANAVNIISNTEFIECGGENASYPYRSAFISNCRCTVEHCKFYHCWHRHKRNGFTAVDPDDNKRTMFAGARTTDCGNNEIIGSAKLV